MSFESLYSVIQSFGHCIVDYLAYMVVDQAIRKTLTNVEDIGERKKIFIFESVVLAAVCVLIYLFDHPPYLLAIATLLTIVYTQVIGRVDFRRFWLLLWTKWDEFEQHEQSMEKMNGLRNATNYVNTQANMGVGLPNTRALSTPTMTPAVWYNSPLEQYQQQQNYAAQNLASASPQVNMLPNPVAMSTPTSMYYPRMQQLNQQTHLEAISPIAYCRVPDYLVHNNNINTAKRRTPILTYRRGPQLARPGIHSYNMNAANNQSPTTESKSTSLRAKLMNAIGMNPYYSYPPGLVNRGQNLCFLNALLQCLAYTPSLLSCLKYDLKCMNQRESKQGNMEFLSELTNTLELLNSTPGSSEVASINPTELRKHLSKLPGSMILHPDRVKKMPSQVDDQHQQQQDCSEVLMWLLQHLHQMLNNPSENANLSVQTSTSPTYSNTDVNNLTIQYTQRHPGSPVHTAMTLNMLRFIYSDLTPQRIADLKNGCRKEIESANGVDSESYAEPIQRLSDLEWLMYKELNNSVVDDLFAGQLVEAQQCMSCNRISVDTQTFTILPVPIAQASSSNGLVYLEECFARYSHVEEMTGSNGLQCSCANPVLPSNGVQHGNKHSGSSTMGSSVIQYSLGSLTRTENTIMQSPSNHLPSHVQPKARCTDGERRSLLRQLPECLVVQLMRFTVSNNGYATKIQRPVKVPIADLDLTKLVVDNVMKREDLTALNASYQYELYAMCLHLGSESTSHGHYVSYVRNMENGRWYKCDDEVVTEVNIEYEVNTRQVRENVYLLFYHKNKLPNVHHM